MSRRPLCPRWVALTLAGMLAAFAVAACLTEVARGAPFEHPSAAGKRGYGQGMVTFAGRGPERWHWAYQLERRKVRQLQRQLVRRWRPTAEYAYRLAGTTYNVPEWELRAVAACESGHNPFARNGRYRGLFQEGPMFERSLHGRAGFSVWDPIANAMTAARTVAREGWAQWECKP